MVTLDGRLAFFNFPNFKWDDILSALAIVQCPCAEEVGHDTLVWLDKINGSGDTMSHVCGLVAIAFQDDGPAS